ncbi:hypothetical protein BKA67DRAFT_656687 [Truncatella angustata]|uniref:NAD(P)-binding domain-containing protein n=1 Tax=Truncatella angustata TaxID=152316 RepID=A0A9P8UUB3_9PEZI|nr:uncharacterized protein BKA67DRAFT_656687 [Truncatella angustata]KAH6658498.1 hypothetical protein BKA67DRAFT_656687 [Truncatella angustata]KAH8196706.1 hypothetical protein TruAng_009135 [Truncatella angustata]
MKLIVAGATGFVGSEVIRLSLERPDITSVIALSRTPISLLQLSKDGADVSKLENVIVKDYRDYPDSVRKAFAGANACIWTIAVTPARTGGVSFEEIKQVCQDYPLIGLRTMRDSGVNRPFRFIYLSGSAAPRDSTKPPPFLSEYLVMRGETENRLLAIASESKGALEVCAAKPGWITDTTFTRRSIMAFVMRLAVSMPSVSVAECSAAMLDQIVHGFDTEPLLNEAMVTIGRRVLSASTRTRTVDLTKD